MVKLLNTEFSPVSCYFLFLMPKSLPEHPILEYPQSVFFPGCERSRVVQSSYQNQRNDAFPLRARELTVLNVAMFYVPVIAKRRHLHAKHVTRRQPKNCGI